MKEQNKIAEVWCIENNDLKHGNKVISKIDYDGLEIAVLKSKRKYEFSDMLIKDEDDIYWSLGIAPIRFRKFFDTTVPENKEYCDKIKSIYEEFNFKKYFEKKINENKYFNKCELKYIAKEHPDIFSKAKRSRENHIEQYRKEQAERKEMEEMINAEKVKSVNKLCQKRIRAVKEKIHLGECVFSKDVEFYKNDNYHDRTIQNCFLYLAQEYGIEIPLATKGFINNRLEIYHFGTGGYAVKSDCKSKIGSTKIQECFLKIAQKVDEELKNEQLQKKEKNKGEIEKYGRR